MLLQDILNKEKNNLDIFRVMAAMMVIYGHAYAILPSSGPGDLLGGFIGFDYSGSLAVKIFFFLSGLVVTNSLLTKRSLIQFLIARFFRIWPALAFTLLVSAFLLGPLLSKQSATEYFSNKKVFAYVYKGLSMNIKYELPGVFEDNAFQAINGSLWSIPHEVFAYLTLAALFIPGLLKPRFRLLTIPFFILILIDPLLENPVLFTWLPPNPEIRLLAPCFAFGALLAIWKDKVDIGWAPCLAAWIAFFVLKQSCCNFYIFYLALFMSIIHLSSQDVLVRLKPTADISYGIYLWGWPVQQILVLFFVDYGIRFNQISAIFISVIMGFLSWYLIEKRSIQYGSHLARKIPSRWLGSSSAT
ncbi:MAG: acyltransferase [Chromatiaceae bacterium]|nr:acyltransferase [Chromatiaceae bacterium]